jgi:hypothetical protein
MSEGMDQANRNTQGQQNNADNREHMSQAQAQTPADGANEDFRGIGETGTSDVGDFGNVAGGTGNNADVSGSAAGATGTGSTGGGMEQSQPGYGSTGQAGYGDQSGGMGGSTGSAETGQQSGQQMDDDGQKLISDSDDEDEDDLGDGADVSSAAGSKI